ncbi:MAG: hypothetical protein GWN99_13315 [Gemmatimonadetes bacterium]|uniref:Uncharacterized protein n=1 Tax=Candidatus Kutchimonas denitrificans TaxID=3056748 RepID=A0AAE4Z9P8_9BACT|nr:hypothetical protein [Gemmatimonadota bacterium]NIR75859.1 hypothetical protein [Candidatus Kutchimonas denitrificans]NIS02026.1 hypothetical protein [Gemmatimonadota bacterium]NIT67830.1 hypothetical protein [Gemmatimonadota bacterium]NIU53817.1 hypothetical protein [Gemmatimonadota bacterium]
MRIEFERSGGVAGLRLSLSIDTDTLPEAEAEEIEKLVEASGFFEMPERTGTPSGADAFVYRVKVESAERAHTVTTSDIDAPSELSPLLERLERLARRARRE